MNIPPDLIGVISHIGPYDFARIKIQNLEYVPFPNLIVKINALINYFCVISAIVYMQHFCRDRLKMSYSGDNMENHSTKMQHSINQRMEL